MSAEGRERDSAKLKEAASLLTKGGTLINDPCDLCSSVQVMYRDKVICVNCGNEKSVDSKSNSVQQKGQENRQVNIQERNKVTEPTGSRPPHEPFERSPKQNIRNHRSDLERVVPALQEQTFLHDKDSSEQKSLRNISLLLIEKISSELNSINGEEGPDLLRRKAETIRIWLGLLQKVKEIERL
ncbi:MAG: Sjogren's syndrome/scleroderma autoantigen 1 family protein [Nitrososphaeraceae archaeon]